MGAWVSDQISLFFSVLCRIFQNSNNKILYLIVWHRHSCDDSFANFLFCTFLRKYFIILINNITVND